MNIDEKAFVREQYATEDRLRARKSTYEHAEGDDPRQFAFDAVAQVSNPVCGDVMKLCSR